MDFTSQYCPERKLLEQCSWDLVSTLSVRTDQLMMLVGKDHAEFIATQASCSELHREILESRNRLLAHRIAHGC